MTKRKMTPTDQQIDDAYFLPREIEFGLMSETDKDVHRQTIGYQMFVLNERSRFLCAEIEASAVRGSLPGLRVISAVVKRINQAVRRIGI